jgi:hypothetical protein
VTEFCQNRLSFPQAKSRGEFVKLSVAAVYRSGAYVYRSVRTVYRSTFAVYHSVIHRVSACGAFGIRRLKHLKPEKHGKTSLRDKAFFVRLRKKPLAFSDPQSIADARTAPPAVKGLRPRARGARPGG